MCGTTALEIRIFEPCAVSQYAGGQLRLVSLVLHSIFPTHSAHIFKAFPLILSHGISVCVYFDMAWPPAYHWFFMIYLLIIVVTVYPSIFYLIVVTICLLNS